MKKSEQKELALWWIHLLMRFHNIKYIPLLRLISPAYTKEWLQRQKKIYKYLRSLINEENK